MHGFSTILYRHQYRLGFNIIRQRFGDWITNKIIRLRISSGIWVKYQRCFGALLTRKYLPDDLETIWRMFTWENLYNRENAHESLSGNNSTSDHKWNILESQLDRLYNHSTFRLIPSFSLDIIKSPSCVVIVILTSSSILLRDSLFSFPKEGARSAWRKSVDCVSLTLI